MTEGANRDRQRIAALDPEAERQVVKQAEAVARADAVLVARLSGASGSVGRDLGGVVMPLSAGSARDGNHVDPGGHFGA